LQISYQHWIPRLIKQPYAWFYFFLEKMAGYLFNAVIVAEPVIAKYFPKRKVTLLRNFPIAASFANPMGYQTRDNIMVYVGLLSKARGVVEMLESHKKASEQVPIRFVLGGKFAPAVLEQELLPQHSVEYRQWLPYEEMIGVLYKSKIGIIVPHPTERYRTNYPVKLFEYMAAGLPVIASKKGESAEFVSKADAGILVDPENADEIANAIVRLITDTDAAEEMGRRGRESILTENNWEKESTKLLKLYGQFVNERCLANP
jgi:glycosyltransferase involved in cell wall biosynthesis